MTAAVKIDRPIVGWSIIAESENKDTPVVYNYEPLPRPSELIGTTYKIKPPIIDDAVYITINDIEMENGERRPFEIFINSKHMDSFQWVTGLTRVLSAMFRLPGPAPVFIVKELQQVFDPKGSYFIPGVSKQCPSILAHIGMVIEHHCRKLGLMVDEELPEYTKRILKEKESVAKKRGVEGQTCGKCGENTLFILDGCLTCTSCGDSKCG